MTPFGIRKKTTLSLLLVLGVWAAGFLWFYNNIPQEKKVLPANSADIIIVLTGGNNRLEYGLELLANNAAKNLFVSGVGTNVGVDDILRQVPNNIRSKISAKQIVIGGKAENTIGNAQEVQEWLAKPAKGTEYKKIILVTSNYHMPRSVLELSSVMPDLSIITAPVITTDNELIFSEYNKYLASKLRHLFISTTKSP